MLITKEIHFHMGHRIPNHKSKCRNIHGHTYRLIVGVDDKIIETKGQSDEGMVIDYSDLKQIIIDNIYMIVDHGFMIYKKDEFANIFSTLLLIHDQKIIFVDFIPTAENIAKWIYLILEQKLIERNIKIKFVELFETPTSSTKFTNDN